MGKKNSTRFETTVIWLTGFIVGGILLWVLIDAFTNPR